MTVKYQSQLLKTQSGIFANGSYTDLNGHSSGSFNVYWYVDDQLESVLAVDTPFVPSLAQQGKNLKFQIGFVDDAGFNEFSPIFDAGSIANNPYTYNSGQPTPITQNFGSTGNNLLDVVLSGAAWEFPGKNTLKRSTQNYSTIYLQLHRELHPDIYHSLLTL